MGLTIELEKLASRFLRKEATGGHARQIIPTLGGSNSQNGVWGFVNSLIGDTFTTLTSSIQWSLSALWGGITTAFQALWNFDWNISDKNLDAQVKTSLQGLSAALGTTLGAATGYTMCGALPGVAIMYFNEPMGQYVLEQLGEQALAEMVGHLTNLVQMTFTSARVAAFAFLYKNVRHLWRTSDDNFLKQLKRKGLKGAQLNKALEERNKPWSFALKAQEKIDAISNETIKTFVQSYVDQFASSCIEAGYVIAGAVDSFYLQQRMANEADIVEVDFTTVGEPSIRIIEALPSG
jgi:hypothetical protein